MKTFFLLFLFAFGVQHLSGEGLSTIDGRVIAKEDGTPHLIFFQYRKPFDAFPRQNLWNVPEALPITYKGSVQSTFWDGPPFLLVYSQTIFHVNDQLSLKLERKAPEQMHFMAISSSNVHNSLLVRHRQEGTFARLEPSGEVAEFPFLENYRTFHARAWSSSRYPAIIFPIQEGLEHPVLCTFDPGFSRGQRIEEGLEGFSFRGFSETHEGLWLLPAQGDMARCFDGTSITPRPLPMNPPLEDLLHFSSPQLGLMASGNGPILYNGNSQTPLNMGDTQPASSTQHHGQNAMLFVVMLIVLFMILRWRQESEVKINPAPPLHPAPLPLRSLAFIMDTFIIVILTFHTIDLLELYPPMDFTSFNGIESLDSQQMNLFIESFAVPNSVVFTITLISILYHVALEMSLGGSFGKMLFRLKVVDQENQPPKLKACFLKALWRTLDIVILPLPSILTALSHPERRSLGDRWAGVRVVQVKRS